MFILDIDKTGTQFVWMFYAINQ